MLRIIGNLPYNISTPVMFHLLQNAELIEDMTFMLQLEVVQRLGAKPGSKNYAASASWSSIFVKLNICLMFPRRLSRRNPRSVRQLSDAARQARS